VRSPLRLILALAVAALGLALAATAAAAPSKLRLEQALASSGIPTQAQSAIVVDLTTGNVVYAKNGGKPRRPASNEKLPVSVAALYRLGPDFRFRTHVLGSGTRRGHVWHGNLVLRGAGDPTLGTRQLRALATQIRQRGIARVQGRVIVDATHYDDLRTAPGWYAGHSAYSAPLSALVVNSARIDGEFSRRPEVSAGVLFRRLLAGQGITVTGSDGSGRVRVGARLLATVDSPPLAEIVERINRYSDNFYAEMLLKELAAQAHGFGTTAQGAQEVVGVMAELGVPLEGVRIADGSGLSPNNRLTAQALASLLVATRTDPAVREPFLRSLPVAGRSGTLAWRMRGTPAHGAVAAKTGTTRYASTLSGYAGGRYAFSILMNGTPVSHWSGRAGQDRFATVLANTR
jgi:serine-type D-Ala-D-Ala carboxypeptidase/endopeptidase (penicillin-binding protein 4)